MSTVGFLINPLSGRIRNRMDTVRAAITTASPRREVTDLADIRSATRELIESGSDVLAIIGGDGTVQAVLTELMLSGQTWPEVAVIPGGTTNMTAIDLHGRLSVTQAISATLRQSARASGERARVQRPLVEVCLPQAQRQYGFCLSSGAVIAGMEHFQKNVRSRGLRDELSASISVMRGFIGLARGERAWTEIADTEYRLAPDAAWRKDQALLLATSLERLILGFRPWWGTQPLPLHVTAVRQAPVKLIRRAPAFVRGRTSAGLTPENGYCSDNADWLEIRPGGAVGLDGEVFPVPAGESVTAMATEPLPFLYLGPGPG